MSPVFYSSFIKFSKHKCYKPEASPILSSLKKGRIVYAQQLGDTFSYFKEDQIVMPIQPEGTRQSDEVVARCAAPWQSLSL